MSRASEFEQALRRPKNFFELDAWQQWDIDKSLGILDWDGDCAHSPRMLKDCPECKARWDEHWKSDEKA